jgi:hypothetical protein
MIKYQLLFCKSTYALYDIIKLTNAFFATADMHALSFNTVNLIKFILFVRIIICMIKYLSWC